MKLKYILVISPILFFSLFQFQTLNAQQAQYRVVPLPQSIEETNAEPFRLSTTTTIQCGVNDEMMSLVMSGAPLNILPEKKGTNSFIFPYQQISIDKFDAVETVSFKIAVKNEESLADIETTAEVTITK